MVVVVVDAPVLVDVVPSSPAEQLVIASGAFTALSPSTSAACVGLMRPGWSDPWQ